MVIMFRTDWITRPSEKAANALSIVGMRSSQRRRGRICSSVRTSISCLVSTGTRWRAFAILGQFLPLGKDKAVRYQVLERQTLPPHDTARKGVKRCLPNKNNGSNADYRRFSPLMWPDTRDW